MHSVKITSSMHLNPACHAVNLSDDIRLTVLHVHTKITVAWNDRRPIGALFPSDCGASCNCKTYSPADCPNPRGWNFLPGKEAAFNVTSPAGVQAFQQAARDYVNNSIQYCKYYLGGPDGTGPAVPFVVYRVAQIWHTVLVKRTNAVLFILSI